MSKDTRRAFLAALDKVHPIIRRAFEQSISDIVNTTQLAALDAAIARNDLQGVYDALKMDARSFEALSAAIGRGFASGGEYQAALAPGRTSIGPVRVRFRGTNPRAQSWVANRSSTLITEIVDDQRAMIREVLERGIELGHNPRRTSLDLIGRRVAGSTVRKGGLIGLTSQQSGFVQNMRGDLSDPSTASKYFTRQRRDRRFDSAVRRSVKSGVPLTDTEIARISGRYSDRLLKYRGDVIARTESLGALNAGRDETVQQMIDDGTIAEDAVKGRWNATGDDRTRGPNHEHDGLDGDTVPHGEPFQSDTGALMLYPGDVSLGAQGRDVIQCRCWREIVIDYLRNVRRA